MRTSNFAARDGCEFAFQACGVHKPQACSSRHCECWACVHALGWRPSIENRLIHASTHIHCEPKSHVCRNEPARVCRLSLSVHCMHWAFDCLPRAAKDKVRVIFSLHAPRGACTSPWRCPCLPQADQSQATVYPADKEATQRMCLCFIPSPFS